MAKSTQKIWFKNKTYGWGWTPVTFEGWLTILIYIISMGMIFSQISRIDGLFAIILRIILPAIILTLVLITITIHYGEKPHWNWGNKHPNQ